LAIQALEEQVMKKEGEPFRSDQQQHGAALWRNALVGQVVQHWKGDLYTVTGTDVDESTGEIRVTYQSHEQKETSGQPFTWSRTVENFTSEVSPGVKRFTEIDTEGKGDAT
jgi:hypothetical protein